MNPEVQKVIDERERCRVDAMYLASVMGYDFVPEVHQELFDSFPKFRQGKPWASQSEIKKWLILWSRGHYKTTAVVVVICQLIVNFPDIRILLMQGSIGVTQTLLHQIKSHFTGQSPDSRLRELFPEYCEDELGSMNNFTVPARKAKGLAQATVTVASPRKIKTGQHYDIGFFDDIVNENNWRSERLLKKVEEDFQMCMTLLDPPFYAVLTGTRYSAGDLYEKTIRSNVTQQWNVSLTNCWKDGEPRFPQQPSKRHPDRLVGFTKEMLLELQRNDPEVFSSQYLNMPSVRGGKKFPPEFMESTLINPDDAPPLSQACFFVDLASVTSTESDDSVIIVGKHDTSMVMYVVDARGGQWSSPDLAENIIAMAMVHRPVKIFFEKMAGCIYFVEYLKLLCKYRNLILPIEFIKVDKQDNAKYIRIGGLEPLFRMKKFRFFAGIPRWGKIVEQFGMFPAGKNRHDDWPDSCGLMAQTFGAATLLTALPKKPVNWITALGTDQDRKAAFDLKEQEPDDGLDGLRF